jgi:hypothetical protein
MGLSLTSRGRVGRADLAVRDLVARVVLAPVGLADPVDPGLADPVDLGLAVRHPADPAVPAHIRDPAVLGRVGLADPAGLDRAARVGLVGRADIRDLVARAGLDLAGPVDPVDPVGPDLVGLVGRADIRDLVARAVLDLAGPVDPGLADPADLDPADRVGPADLVGLVGLAGRAIRADRHHRLTRPEVTSTAAAPRWAARGMCRTASAHPVTAHRLRPPIADGVGMADLHPERRRLSGMDRRPRVAGMVHHLPVVGTARGTGRRAT